MTDAGGSDTGTGTRDADFSESSPGPPVETVLAFLASGSYCVALAVQTDA